jgi:hypothetical protein
MSHAARPVSDALETSKGMTDQDWDLSLQFHYKSRQHSEPGPDFARQIEKPRTIPFDYFVML